MKKKKQPPDPDNDKPPSHRTIKCSLKSILKDYKTVQPIINDLVVRCNDIVIETYQFIRLYCLKLYHDGRPIPEIDDQFILYSMKAMGTRDNRGKKAENMGLQKELAIFYEAEFKSLIMHDKFDLKNMSFLLPYLATQIHTAIHNNLKEHFVTRLYRFINNTVTPYEQDLSKEQTRDERSKLKKALYDNTTPPERYIKWYNLHRDKMLPQSWDVSLAYDCKVYPCKYLPYSFYMNEVLEQQGFKLFQPLSLRKNIVPHYITIDTASIINLLTKGNKGELLKKVKENQERIWDQFFNLDLKVFKQKNYRFNYTLQTDGVAVSLLFVHKLHNGRKTCQHCNVGDDISIQYVEDLSAEKLADIQCRKIVGGDPGKYSMIYLADAEGNKLRYNAFQRRTESMAKRNTRIIQTEKKKYNVIEKETELSDKNSKTIDYDKFKEYLKDKNKLNAQLKDFYLQDLFRKLKWRRFVYTQKSEDRFLDNIEKTFGTPEDICIAYGDWSRSTQMKHFVPTKGIGLRKLIARRFMLVMVNEFRTSKLCCHCHKELCHMHVQKDNKTKKLFRCLVCKGCVSSESENIAFITRDLNSAINIRNLAHQWVHFQTRPLVFSRTEGVASTSVANTTEEKVGQSVDFTVGQATNP